MKDRSGFPADWLNRCHFGDCLDTMRRMPDGIAQTCVTSPPYFGLRDYGHEGQIGLEETPAAFALYTGARRGEVLAIKPADVGSHSLTIHAQNTKTLRTRVVPIVDPLWRWLSVVPLPYKDYEGLKSGFQRGRKKAGMEHVNFHDLRHSCASILIASGADLYTVSKILGHAAVTTTQRYAHMQVEQQRVALDKAFA